MPDPRAGLDAAIAERRQARQKERTRERRRKVVLWAVRVLGTALVFFVGLAVGRAVQEAPRPGGTQTRVKTLEPSTAPAVTRTVTVTTGGT